MCLKYAGVAHSLRAFSLAAGGGGGGGAEGPWMWKSLRLGDSMLSAPLYFLDRKSVV